MAGGGSAEDLLSRIEKAEKSLRSQLRLPQPDQKTVKPLRTALIGLHEELITSHHSIACKSEAEQSLWKLGFYKRIEDFRKRHARMTEALEDPAKKQRAAGALELVNAEFLRFLNKSLAFYTTLMVKLASACDLDIPGYSNPEISMAELERLRAGRGELGAMVTSCQRCLTYMGDLERYRALYLSGGAPD